MMWLKAFRLKSDNASALKSDNASARRRAVEKLAGSHDSHDTDLLVASLEDESDLVRCAAVRALETAPEQACIQGLLAALRDQSDQVRAVAAKVLGRRGDRSVAWPLSSLLDDPSPAVREAAAHALKQLGWKPPSAEQSVLDIGRSTRAAFSAGRAVLNPLTGDLNHDTAFQRRTAVETLKEVYNPSRVGPLIQALSHEDPATRASAIHSLDPEREEVVTVELLKLLRDREVNVRLAATQVLSRRMECPPAYFLPLLKDPHFEIRLAAVQFLGKFSHIEIAEVIEPLLSDPDNDVRIATAKSLGQICAASSIQPLVLALADEEPQVRSAAEYALGQIDRDWQCSATAHRALKALEPVLLQRPAWVRASILRILERIKKS